MLAWVVAAFAAVLCIPPDRAQAANGDWTLSKTASPTTYSAAGQVINYTYVITNVRGQDGSLASLTDDKATITDCSPGDPVPAAGLTCHGTYTTTATDVSNGSITNHATVTGDSCNDGCSVTATASATVKFNAPLGSITIVANASGDPTFNFTSTIAGATSFSLTTAGGTASRTFSGLAPGNYSVTEVNLPLHWTLSNITCSGDTGGKPTTVNVSALTASIGLDGGESITCTFNNVFQLAEHIQKTQAIIEGFLNRRIQLLADDGPDRNRLVRRIPGVLWGDGDPAASTAAATAPFSFAGNPDNPASRLSFAASLSQLMAYAQSRSDQSQSPILGKARPRPSQPTDQGWDVWAEAHFNEFVGNAGTLDNRGRFNVAYLGADYLFMRSVLVGALVQYDWASESSATLNDSISGQGWMAGPYMSARLSRDLFFDARAAWGTSRNEVNPFGLYTDRFATHRWLLQSNLTGNWWLGRFRVTPSAGLTFVSEKQLNYTDSLGVLIPEQTVSLGRFAFGPEFAYRAFGANGVIYEPLVSIKGVWDFVRPDTVTIDNIVVSSDAWHAMAQAGIMAYGPNHYAIRVVGQYDGIGSSTFHSYGGQIWINVPLH